MVTRHKTSQPATSLPKREDLRGWIASRSFSDPETPLTCGREGNGRTR